MDNLACTTPSPANPPLGLTHPRAPPPGDVLAVRRLVLEGEDVHQTVTLINQNRQEVQGITPLYLVGWRPRGACSRLCPSAGFRR